MSEPILTEAIKARLAGLYREPDRHYHGLAHIEALLGLLSEYRSSLHDPHAVEAAVWFHDAIYDSRAKDNEEKSALLAQEWLAGRVDAPRLERVAAMIRATATHQVPALADDAARQDAALFLDMDLSILGARPDLFDAYERAVREEYAWVEDAAWRMGRTAVLTTFLARGHIFHTRLFTSRYEAQARANMSRSLAALKQ